MFYLPVFFVATAFPILGDYAPLSDTQATTNACQCVECKCSDCGCLRGEPCTCGDECACTDCGCLGGAANTCGGDCACGEGACDAGCDCATTGECRCGTVSARETQCGPACCRAAR